MISRALLLAEMKRALGDRAGAERLLKELEERLPTDGRLNHRFENDTAVLAAQAAILTGEGPMPRTEDLMWWHPEKKDAIHIHDLRNGHLINIVQMFWRGYQSRQRVKAEAVAANHIQESLLSNEWAAVHPQFPLLFREAAWRGLTVEGVPGLDANMAQCSECHHGVHGKGVPCPHPGYQGEPGRFMQDTGRCDCPGSDVWNCNNCKYMNSGPICTKCGEVPSSTNCWNCGAVLRPGQTPADCPCEVY